MSSLQTISIPILNRSIHKQTLLWAILVVITTAIMIFLYGDIDYTKLPQSQWELQYYRQMAAVSPNLDWSVPEPMVYRILGPFLAGLISHDVIGLKIFTSITSILLGLTFYLFLGKLSIKPFYAFAGTLCFVCNKWFFGRQSWNYFQINDTLSHLFIIILFWMLYEKRWLLFGCLLFLGTMARETALIVVPVALLFAIEKKYRKKEMVNLIIACIPGCVFFITIRLLVVPENGQGILYYVHSFSYYIGQIISPVHLFHYFVNSVLPLFFLPIIFVKDTYAILKKNIYMFVYFVIVFFCAFFGGDTERLVAPWFVFYYYIIAKIFQDNFSQQTGLLYLVLVLSFIASFHHRIGLWTLPDKSTMMVVSGCTLIGVTVLGVIAKKKIAIH